VRDTPGCTEKYERNILMSIENKNLTYQFFKDFFEGDYSAEEAAEHLEWMCSPENCSKFEKYVQRLLKEVDPDSVSTNSDLSSILDKVHHTIRIEESKNSTVRSLQPGKDRAVSLKKGLFALGKVAAILLIPLLVYNGWQMNRHRAWIENQTEVVYNEIKCPMGAQSRFELPDGTTGSLNNGSTLRYPIRFTGDQREVELFGEAFFDVVHSERMPFIIKTVALDVKVLGTRVNVYSYPDETYQEITLESGTVELIQKSEGQEVVIAEMKPGQHVHFEYGDLERPNIPDVNDLIILDGKDPSSQQLSSGEMNLTKLDEGDLYMIDALPDRYTGWTEGKLILRNDPMPILLRRVERWYSVKFNILDQRINDYTYRATFEEENLDQVLKLLSLTGPLEFTKLPRKQLEDGTYQVQEINVTIK